MRKSMLKHTQITSTFDTKNNTAQLYSVSGSFDLHWNFPTLLRDVPDSSHISNSFLTFSEYKDDIAQSAGLLVISD